MKHSNSILLICLAFTVNMPAQNDFSKDQLFNRGASPNPYIGLDLLRKENPYIVIRNISNATNGTQFNKEKYVTIPTVMQNGLYSVLGFYRYDSLKHTWMTEEESNYFIGFDFNSKVVPWAYVHKHFKDSAWNNKTKTSFTFRGKNMPDTQNFYTIGLQDTTYFGRNLFYYDSLNRITLISNHLITGYSKETYLEYMPDGKLRKELNIVTKTQFAIPDSFSRYTYTYDSGVLMSSLEEMYGLPGNPDAWTATRQVTYGYDAKGRLASDRIYLVDSSYQLALDQLHLYTYNMQDQVETYIHMRNYQGSFVNRHKLEIFYKNGSARYGYEYPWDDIDYSHVASRYYIFSSEDITDIPNVERPARTLSIVPNPALQQISLPPSLSGQAISIIDSHGKTVITVREDHDEHIDISTLAPGIYMIKTNNYLPASFIKA